MTLGGGFGGGKIDQAAIAEEQYLVALESTNSSAKSRIIRRLLAILSSAGMSSLR